MEKDVNKDKKKQRGIFLNIMILLLIIGDLQIPYYLLNPDALRTVYSSIPSWYPIYAVLAAYFASKILVDLAYILPERQIAVFATTAIGAGLWFWAIYRKRSVFD
jgi:hypothetical protein